MKRSQLLSLCAVACGIVLVDYSSAFSVTLDWTAQQGTVFNDFSNAVSADGLGHVYISGYTDGALGGFTAGGSDAFLSKYDDAGNLFWMTQAGTSNYDVSTGVSADGLGNVYITGWTGGSLGAPNAGATDAFVSMYDSIGTLIFTRQLGTSFDDRSEAVSADGLGNVYIAGWTLGGSLGGPNAGGSDAFLAKYDSAGTSLWTKQLGTSAFDGAQGISVDGLGYVYISGYTYGSLGGANAGGGDVFLSKYDAAGILQWSKQIGSPNFDEGRDVSVDGLGNVYLTGRTYGSLGGPFAGGSDAFLVKYDAAGTLLWNKQIGTSGAEWGEGVSADGLGNVYVSGPTTDNLGGPNAGSHDVFVRKYDSTGTLLWAQQLGTPGTDYGNGASADGLGNVYLSGATDGSLGGPNTGNFDAFVAKYTEPVPEPSALTLLLGAIAILFLCGRKSCI
jgi:hypothetical protein